MKTSQKLITLALVLILILSFAACGAANKSAQDESTTYESTVEVPKAEDGSAFDVAASEAKSVPVQETSGSTAALTSTEKIIYSGYADIETLEFDKTIEDLLKMVNESGGFIQNSSVTGGDYNSIYSGKQVSRSANYTVRIPIDKFESVTDSLKTLGNVVSNSTNADNITMQYTDTESRLSASRIKEARLLELLSKATSMEDILAIENSLSNVRYEIESLTSQIKNWDSLISYSTLTISIREVALYSKDNTSTIGYGQQLKEAFVHSLYAVGHFFKGFFRFLVGAFPVLVVMAVFATPIYFIVKAVRNKKKGKMLNITDKSDGNKPQQ